MAIIQCEKHGLQHVAFTSLYIQLLIINNRAIDEELVLVKLYTDIFESYTYFWSNLEFLDSLGVDYRREPSFMVIDGLGEERSFEVSARTVPVCIECYNEFAQRNNLVFPAEAYE